MACLLRGYGNMRRFLVSPDCIVGDRVVLPGGTTPQLPDWGGLKQRAPLPSRRRPTIWANSAGNRTFFVVRPPSAGLLRKT